MKKMYVELAVIVLASLLLGGCLTLKLPEKTEQNRNLGVLAIPKRTVIKPGVPQGLSGYATEVQVQKKGVNEVFKSIIVDRYTGRAFKFFDSFEPGEYVVSGYATVPQDSTVAVQSSKSPIRELDIPFSITAGSITVLPVQFLTVKKSVSVARFSSYLNVIPLKDDLEKWQQRMHNGKNQASWNIVWSK